VAPQRRCFESQIWRSILGYTSIDRLGGQAAGVTAPSAMSNKNKVDLSFIKHVDSTAEWSNVVLKNLDQLLGS
jgi:hypothetical protein